MLLLLSLAGAAYSAAADGQKQDPPLEAIPVGSKSELPRVAPDEVERAKAALAADPQFARALDGRTWRVSAELPNTLNGEKVGVGLFLELDAPLTSNGPWRDLYCQGTVTREFMFPYGGVSTIVAVFDAGGHRLLSFKPLPSPSLTFGEDPDATRLQAPECPEGFEDVED